MTVIVTAEIIKKPNQKSAFKQDTIHLTVSRNQHYGQLVNETRAFFLAFFCVFTQ